MNNVEKVFIIQPKNYDNYKVLHDEAIALIESAGAAYCGTAYQNIKTVNPATYLGSGKLEEIRQILFGLEGITVLFNGELSPSQTLNISAALDGVKVIDRTTLILDIFASRAVSSEGKIQVELAQLRYLYPRLKGKGEALSRLGGGIGSRGPGETKLETDRRHIRARIKYLEERLEKTERRRRLNVMRRGKDDVKTIALVGYTNAGKSTLMNALTGAGVLEKDAFFATLDPTARKFNLGDRQFVLVDTVGFLQDLPHYLVESFKSTLESALNCDLALIVADCRGDYDMQFDVTFKTLHELGFDSKFIKVLNKCEDVEDFTAFGNDCVCISAKYGLGLDELKKLILKQFEDEFVNCTLFINYKDMSRYEEIKSFIAEQSREYIDDGIIINCSAEKKYFSKIESFIRK